MTGLRRESRPKTWFCLASEVKVQAASGAGKGSPMVAWGSGATPRDADRYGGFEHYYSGRRAGSSSLGYALFSSLQNPKFF